MITLLNKFDDKYIIKEKDVLDIASAYIKENAVEKYLNDINFDSTSNYLAYYNIRTNDIVFNDEKIINNAYKLYDLFYKEYHVNEDNYTYFVNFYYLYIIYHELTHVSQKKRYENSNDENIYNYLYDLCSNLRKSDVTFYKSKHDIFPMEIEANNKGTLKAYNLMQYTKLPNKECQMLYLRYLSFLITDYERINNFRIKTPIEKLSDENDFVDINKIYELTDHSHLSKIERLNLGLNITVKEYDGIEKEKQKILRHR